MRDYFAPNLLPVWFAVATMLFGVFTTWGSTSTRLDRVEKQVTTITTEGTIPMARLEAKLEALQSEVRLLRDELRERKGVGK